MEVMDGNHLPHRIWWGIVKWLTRSTLARCFSWMYWRMSAVALREGRSSESAG